ncbi:MAG: serine/threonine-protein kinase [Deltaproteobacteria bacterium]|nr:serine/threonine-protein kinase [Deltaproteobacteria bacterium]
MATSAIDNQKFGPFVLFEQLGVGGMGEVWLARAVGLPGGSELCVVKTLKDNLSSNQEALSRFLDETRVAMLLDHPCVGRVVDTGRVDEKRYLALEFIQGVDVNTLLARGRARRMRLEESVALFVAACALDGLEHAHTATHPLTGQPLGIVHRDVSPHNIMCDVDGNVKVIDFGIAVSSLNEVKDEQGIVLGKLAYMAPEQARGDVVDARCDVFAMGVALYELVTGERYWGDLPREEVYQRVGTGNWIPTGWPRLPADVKAILPRMLAAQPKDRFHTGEARDAVVAALAARGGPAAACQKLATLVRTLAPEEMDRAARARGHNAQQLPACGPPTESLALHEVAALEALRMRRESSPTTISFFIGDVPFAPPRPPMLGQPLAAPAPPIRQPVVAAPTQVLERAQPRPVPVTATAPPAPPAPAKPPIALLAGGLVVFVIVVVLLAAFALRPPPVTPVPVTPVVVVVDAGVAPVPVPVPLEPIAPVVAAPVESVDPSGGWIAQLKGCRAPCAPMLLRALGAKRFSSLKATERAAVKKTVQQCIAVCRN